MDLDDRMKAYEDVNRHFLTPRMPAVIRLDGKAFHTLTRGEPKPYSQFFQHCMVQAASLLLNVVPGRMAYCQSDEVSILLVDYNKFDSQQWFGGNIQKMVSVSASAMGVFFSNLFKENGFFDARVFTVPERDIENYFVWRQDDCVRNAISGAAQANFSNKQLHGMSQSRMLEMMDNKGYRFYDLPLSFRQGTVVEKYHGFPAPIFKTNKDFLKQYLKVEEE